MKKIKHSIDLLHEELSRINELLDYLLHEITGYAEGDYEYQHTMNRIVDAQEVKVDIEDGIEMLERGYLPE